MDKNKKIILIFGFAILLIIVGIQYFNVPLMGSLIQSNTFQDDVQNYETNYTEVWTPYTYRGGSVSVVNYPTEYPTSKCIKLRSAETAYYNGDGQYNTASITTPEFTPSSYFAYTVRAWYRGDNGEGTGYPHIEFYDNEGSSLGSVNLYTYHEAHDSNNRYEFVKSDTNLLLYIDGESQGTVLSLSSNEEFASVKLTVHKRDEGYADTATSLHVDDFSTGSIIGSDNEWTEIPTEIDFSYGIKSMKSFPDAEYKFNVYRVTTNELINETIIQSNVSDKCAGFITLPRYETFGSEWDMYRTTITRDGTKIAENTFLYTYTGSGFSYSPIILPVYCDAESQMKYDGGEWQNKTINNYSYLIPPEDENKTYPIYIDVQSASSTFTVKVEGDSSLVNTTPLEIINLGTTFDLTINSVDSGSTVGSIYTNENVTIGDILVFSAGTTTPAPSSGGGGGSTTVVPTTVEETQPDLNTQSNVDSSTEIETTVIGDNSIKNHQSLLGLSFLLTIIILYGIKKFSEKKK